MLTIAAQRWLQLGQSYLLIVLCKIDSLSGNRTPVSSVTDWDTDHYTNGDML